MALMISSAVKTMNKISISRIKLFKACRRAYELRYVYDLEPVQTAESLEVGKNYHERIEEYVKTGKLPVDDSKESAMAEAYVKYIAPQIHIKTCEEWFEKDGFIGRVDGIADDGCLVEHKTTSMSVEEDYEYMLQWDEQIMMYMWLTGTRKIYYTVIRKPSIRQKKGETDQEFHDRCLDWYSEDTKLKIRIYEVIKTDEEINDFERDLMMIRDEMGLAENYKRFYKNTGWCRHWGRMCEYAQICLHYDPNEEYVNFRKRGNES